MSGMPLQRLRRSVRRLRLTASRWQSATGEDSVAVIDAVREVARRFPRGRRRRVRRAAQGLRHHQGRRRPLRGRVAARAVPDARHQLRARPSKHQERPVPGPAAADQRRRIELLDHPRLITQLVGLERRTAARRTRQHRPRTQRARRRGQRGGGRARTTFRSPCHGCRRFGQPPPSGWHG